MDCRLFLPCHVVSEARHGSESMKRLRSQDQGQPGPEGAGYGGSVQPCITSPFQVDVCGFAVVAEERVSLSRYWNLFFCCCSSWIFFFFCISFYFSATPMVCGILVPQPGIEPAPLAMEAPSLNHWATREVSGILKNWAARSS